MQLKEADGPLLVRVPLRTPLAEIESFVRKNTEWVLRTRAKLAMQPRTELSFAEGAVFYYLGQPLRLRYGESTEPDSENGILQVAAHSEALAARGLLLWYRKQALRYLRNRARELAERFDFEYAKISVNGAERRWGSCSSAHHLHFSWRLLMCPADWIDYVVVHELCHTVEMNHSARFWTQVESCVSDWRRIRREMNRTGWRYRIWTVGADGAVSGK